MRIQVLVMALAALLGAATAAVGQGPPSGGGGIPTSTAAHTTRPRPPPPPPRGGGPLSGRAMWIWELQSTPSSIVATAHQYGVSTVIIKSSDGTGMWSQFTSTLVGALHAGGIRVCAWQYVYGNHPIFEAQAGAAAVHDGANCLVIDAEVEYDGKYAQAQQYMTALRKAVGWHYPLALAGLPYVDYHPAFPYSVFLGRGAAQYNAPQMYWADIGTTVDGVFAHTYVWNRPYNRPIFPLGQVYNAPPQRQIVRFRQISRYYGARGVSWWDWQLAPVSAWRAIARPVGRLTGFEPTSGMASVAIGAQGDLVVWAQEHLVSAGRRIAVDGAFGPKTLGAVRAFQSAHGLQVTGVIDIATWDSLLRYPPAYVHWVLPRKHRHAARAGIAGARGAGGTPPPMSATLPDVRDEIAGAGGAGRPGRRLSRASGTGSTPTR
jgi:hypothetical protein